MALVYLGRLSYSLLQRFVDGVCIGKDGGHSIKSNSKLLRRKEGYMGTMRGEVRGKTKTEVVEKYRKAKKKNPVFLDYTPSSEKEAMKQMTKDEATDEWVLKLIFTM